MHMEPVSKLTTSRDALQKLNVDGCGFRHHFTWNNGGKHINPCAATIGDQNLLCAHSIAPQLKEALSLARSEGLITPLLFDQLNELVSPNPLLRAEVRLFNLGTVASAQVTPTRENQAWLSQLARHNNSPVPAEQLSPTMVEDIAKTDQKNAGASRVALRDFLVELFNSNIALGASRTVKQS